MKFLFFFIWFFTINVYAVTDDWNSKNPAKCLNLFTHFAEHYPTNTIEKHYFFSKEVENLINLIRNQEKPLDDAVEYFLQNMRRIDLDIKGDGQNISVMQALIERNASLPVILMMLRYGGNSKTTYHSSTLLTSFINNNDYNAIFLLRVKGVQLSIQDMLTLESLGKLTN